MADAENGAKENGAASAAQAQIKMQIVGQYIRDLSFENNVVQQGISGEVNPDIQVQVSIDAKKRQVENQYEVVSKFIITSKNKGSDQTLFLMELDYGGIFMIENVPDEQMHPFLFIECPRMLFPYARRIVSDVTRDGGFPQLNLENIDFVALYRQTLLQRQAAQKAAAEAAEKDEPAS